MDQSEPTLAETLRRWKRRQRLNGEQLAAAAGITRHHLWLIRTGKVRHPTDVTIRKLAQGLATDPDDQTVDQEAARLALRDLSLANGSPDLSAQPVPGSLEAAILAAVGNPQATDFWASLIRTWPTPTPVEQQIVQAVLERLGRHPGGEDVQARLLAILDGELTAALCHDR